MQIDEIVKVLEDWAPPQLQENYDNSGLVTGSAHWECSGILVALDSTEEVIEEAIQQNCNLIIAHHPILFNSIKSLTGKNYVERTLIKAIKSNVAIYALHTNLDNMKGGVNAAIARQLGLTELSILLPKQNLLKKLVTYAPPDVALEVKAAIFKAGAGHIGNYSECSFTSTGTGTFKPEAGASPYSGKIGERLTSDELKIEVLFPTWLQESLIKALKTAHPYEEVAYDIIPLSNENQSVGSGMLGSLPEPLDELAFLELLKKQFHLPVIRHTQLLNQPIQRVAICGGAGSFLTKAAIAAGADSFVTADVKYHEFFDADNRLLLADIGHYESEQFTIDWMIDFLTQKFPTFAVLKTSVTTNPVRYL